MSNTLITINNATLSFGTDPVLENIKLQIDKGERICLIGRNGTGKSTLLKVVAGEIKPDAGDIYRMPQLRTGQLVQELPQKLSHTVFEEVASGLTSTGELLSSYHALLAKLSNSATESELKKLEQLQHTIDACNGWQFEQHINRMLSRLNLSGERKLSELSGGWQRRVNLAKALVSTPDLLLLDEPTNHLDIETIQWLEEELLTFNGGILFITHDRSLLKKLATRIIELDRGQLTSWPGDYNNFLRRKEEMLAAEEKHNAEFDKKLSAEERWIRQGIKARRTRNEGRVRALEALRRERAKRRNLQGNAKFDLNAGSQSGQLVIEAKNISHYFNEQALIKSFSVRIMRGDRIGLLGPNGIGKSTLLNILLGKLEPQQGSITLGSKLEIAYFDQRRTILDPEKTVLENFAPAGDTIVINNKPRHVISYLSDFLFTPERLHSKAKVLSGGECNRLMLANLFRKPSNLLIMDEPTNDLDLETLELLEELLSNYQGTLLLVSHDRAFLDNIVTSTLAFEGMGIVNEYVGGYQDWLRQRKSIPTSISPKIIEEKPPVSKLTNKTKLSYKEQRELDELPKKIEQLEHKQLELQQQTADPKFYQQSADIVAIKMSELKQIEEILHKVYERWEQLENFNSNT